jgi:hypothetical protein
MSSGNAQLIHKPFTGFSQEPCVTGRNLVAPMGKHVKTNVFHSGGEGGHFQSLGHFLHKISTGFSQLIHMEPTVPGDKGGDPSAPGLNGAQCSCYYSAAL